jgi:hypothetical protein
MEGGWNVDPTMYVERSKLQAAERKVSDQAATIQDQKSTIKDLRRKLEVSDFNIHKQYNRDCKEQSPDARRERGS